MNLLAPFIKAFVFQFGRVTIVDIRLRSELNRAWKIFVASARFAKNQLWSSLCISIMPFLLDFFGSVLGLHWN